MKIENISASSYSTWDWCEWQWVLKYILKFKDSAGFSALAGTIAHRVTELLSLYNMAERSFDHDFSRIRDLDYLWDVCFEYYTSRDLVNGPALSEPKTKTKIRNIKAGLEWLMTTQHNPLTAKTIQTEMVFDVDMSGPQWVVKINPDGTFKYLKVRGRIDRIDEVATDVIEIVDYKSGKAGHWPPREGSPEKTAEDFYQDFQALVYFWHYKRLFPKATIIITFIFIAEKKSFSVTMSEIDAQILEDKLMQRMADIKQNGDPKRDISWKCKFLCQFGKDGTCEKVWKEKENYGLDFVTDYYLELNRRD